MRFYVLKNSTLKKLTFIFIVLAILSLNIGGSCFASVFFYKPVRKIPIYRVNTETKNIALTFDAAWGSDKTLKILDELQKHEVQATFFLVGMWVDKNEDLVKKISDLGHEVETHSNLHPDLTKKSESDIENELSVSKQKIEKITNKTVKFFRPPYGAYNNTVVSQAEKLGLTTIQWDVDTLDWKGISAQTIISNALKKAKSGSIILCHNNSDNIVSALPGLILGLKSRGYNFVTMQNLVYEGDYTVSSSGEQIKIK